MSAVDDDGVRHARQTTLVGQAFEREDVSGFQASFRSRVVSAAVSIYEVGVPVETVEQRIGVGMSCLRGELSGRHFEIRSYDGIDEEVIIAVVAL